ncbi:MAG TPA: transcription termination factor Rho [Ilumatobacteraceae bacterium]|nr:transcription termination factor Rho [Ilumatobacteraceae bacterium]
MTAQALEQSVLESKDKDQLLAIAKALGLKASARNKKAEIIDQILTTTGSEASGDGPSATATVASASSGSSGSSKAAASTAARGDADPTPSANPLNGRASAGSSGATYATLDEDPPADWELEVGDADDDVTADPASSRTTAPDSINGDDSAGDATGGPSVTTQPSNERGNNGRTDARQAGGQQGQRPGGGQQGGGQSAGAQHGQTQQRPAGPVGGGGIPGGEEDGDSRNRRRRRRRKGKGGQEGPQGDDRDLLEAEEPISNEPVAVAGYLDMRDEGYGFLRVNGYLPSRDDAYIPVKLARQYGLRKGDHITGLGRPAGRNEKNPALLEISTVNGLDPEVARSRPRFEDLTALFPDERLTLEDPSEPSNMMARIIDLISPIGKGQRGIIVSPPKAGKTTVMKAIASSIEKNNPDVRLIVLLIDERPEEVTDIRRLVKGEVISSTFDRPSEEHTQVAEMAIEKAKRMVEMGEDVVVILDGITRLSRAYNLAAPASGRILSGGIDAGALYPPKKFFGAARNVEEGGSLTILATALVETNSRMDEAIFEEFKGTGNMELRLDRRLAERRIYPAIDVDASSTRHEELLFDRKQLQMVWKLRRVLSGLAADGNAAPGLELLMDRLKTFRTNEEFLNEIGKTPSM